MVDDQIPRTLEKGPLMRMPKTPQQQAGTLAYVIGYCVAVATMVKFAWWIWSQPW